MGDFSINNDKETFRDFSLATKYDLFLFLQFIARQHSVAEWMLTGRDVREALSNSNTQFWLVKIGNCRVLIGRKSTDENSTGENFWYLDMNARYALSLASKLAQKSLADMDKKLNLQTYNKLMLNGGNRTTWNTHYFTWVVLITLINFRPSRKNAAWLREK